MTATSFASINPFRSVAASRQALHSARLAVDAAESACTCPGTSRRCSCVAAPAIKAAEAAEREALANNSEREAAWVMYHAAR